MENIDITLQEPNISNIDSVLSGPQGPKGDPGEPGRDGVSPTINVGTVTTLTAGSPASVSNSGSTTNVILDFGIPTGPQGIQGPAGENGTDGVDGVSPTISVGNTTTLDPNSPATVTNVGTNTNVVLDFGIPQGKQGVSDNCLSVPTVVGELPEDANPKTFYFVPKKDDETTTSGSSLTLNITEEYGRLESFQIDGYLDTSTPGTLTPLSGNITITVDSDPYVVNIDSTYLAKVNDVFDYIYYDNTEWKVARNIGYIASYNGETITTDYISTSGTLTTGDEVYFVKEEPEVILIEDTNITDVLNQIMSTKFEEGTSTITSSANVTANLEIKYYSYVEKDQYDKYTYVIATSNYEKIGGGSSEIADGSVTTAKLADSSVTTDKLDNSSVTASKLDDSSVTTAKISDGNVTGTKIASDTVEESNIKWTSIHPSTTEKVVGTWIDGTTPVYERAFSGSVALTANTFTRVELMSENVMPVGAGGWWQTYSDQWGTFNAVWGSNGQIFSSVGRRKDNGVWKLEMRLQTTASYTASYEIWVRYIKLS